MTKIRQYLGRLGKLVEKEEHRSALYEIESEKINYLESCELSLKHQALLLLISRIYYYNQRYKKS